jgi:hypothetical protein
MEIEDNAPIRMKDMFVAITDEASKTLSQKDGWRENSIFLYTEALSDEYGKNSHLVRINWLIKHGITWKINL